MIIVLKFNNFKGYYDFCQKETSNSWMPLDNYHLGTERARFVCPKCNLMIRMSFNQARTRACPYCRRYPSGFSAWVSNNLGSDYQLLSWTMETVLGNPRDSRVEVRHLSSKCNCSSRMMTLRSIGQGERCGACFGSDRKLLADKEFKQSLIKYGRGRYKQLSKKESHHSATKLQCQNGHIFSRCTNLISFCEICPKCKKEIRLSRKKLKSQEVLLRRESQLLQHAHDKFYDKVKDDSYVFVGKYSKNLHKYAIKHKCLDGHSRLLWTNVSFFEKINCPHCALITKTLKKRQELLKQGLLLVSPFKGRKHKVAIYCPRCKKTNVVSQYDSWARDRRCPCYKLEQLKDQKTAYASNRLDKVWHGRYVLESRVTKMDTIAKIKCKVCSKIWYPELSKLIAGKIGCPNCRKSSGEQLVGDYLNQRGIEYTSQAKIGCIDKAELPFDFLLPSYNILIEYQGKQHYQPPKNYFGGRKKYYLRHEHDYIKAKFSHDNSYILVSIPYTYNTPDRVAKYIRPYIERGDRVNKYKDWLSSNHS